ncbi:MAG: ATP-binding protein [Deltaproteobacteria bacterium]|nr:ATP-binding protein [Deltaproteobacteria bacterium]
MRWIGAQRGYQHLSPLISQDLRIALQESLANAFQHGCCHQQRPAQVKIGLTAKKIILEVFDAGPPYLLRPKTTMALIEHGRGLGLILQAMDRCELKRRGQVNTLIMVKSLVPKKNIDLFVELIERLNQRLRERRAVADLYQFFLEFIGYAFNVNRASLMILEAKSQQLQMVASLGYKPNLMQKIVVKPGQGIAGRVFSKGKAELMRHAPNPRYQSEASLSVPIVASPLKIGEETLGVVNITDRRGGMPLKSEDIKWLYAMASQLAAVIKIRELLK